ncbi:hypothetical protein BJX65DRAFT_264599 [Aspergillus insuetus]
MVLRRLHMSSAKFVSLFRSKSSPRPGHGISLALLSRISHVSRPATQCSKGASGCWQSRTWLLTLLLTRLNSAKSNAAHSRTGNASLPSEPLGQ